MYLHRFSHQSWEVKKRSLCFETTTFCCKEVQRHKSRTVHIARHVWRPRPLFYLSTTSKKETQKDLSKKVYWK
jgi:hypothetical protein